MRVWKEPITKQTKFSYLNCNNEQIKTKSYHSSDHKFKYSSDHITIPNRPTTSGPQTLNKKRSNNPFFSFARVGLKQTTNNFFSFCFSSRVVASVTNFRFWLGSSAVRLWRLREITSFLFIYFFIFILNQRQSKQRTR